MSDDTSTPALPDSVTVPLQYPVIKHGKDSGDEVYRVEALTLRRPKARDMRAMDKAEGEVGKMMALASRLCGEAEAILDELEAVDFMAVNQAVAGFLPGGLKTGPI